MQNTALIFGITGQDGAYLAQHLLERGYRVVGASRRTSDPSFGRLEALGVREHVETVDADLVDETSVRRAVQRAQPTEVYNLAALTHVGASFELAAATGDVTGLGAVRVLDACRDLARDARVYQASSSEMFGGRGTQAKLDENAPMIPRSPYAAAKLYAHWMAVTYREAYDMHVSSGILFNHESPLRGEQFVTRKITSAAARISLGLATEVRLGNCTARRDWGYAPEYVEAMHLMLQQDAPDEYVIATGVSHSVAELAELAFGFVGLDWRDHVVIDSSQLRPVDVDDLVGDSTKAKQVLGWEARTTFEELVHMMVDSDIALLSAGATLPEQHA